MAMNSYYTDTLYPLQDKVLKIIDALGTPFYLTGGTALSRCYLHHRYSDDLDFFVNNEPKFVKVDFVNDVAFRYGNVEKKILFSRVDTIENILSNKISAVMSRDEAKDVVDISLEQDIFRRELKSGGYFTDRCRKTAHGIPCRNDKAHKMG